MPNLLRAKSLNPDASGSLRNLVSELSMANARDDRPSHLGISTRVNYPLLMDCTSKGRLSVRFAPHTCLLDNRVGSRRAQVHSWSLASLSLAESQGRELLPRLLCRRVSCCTMCLVNTPRH